jgi:hypothetical protein
MSKNDEAWLKLEIETLRKQRDRLREAIKTARDSTLELMHTTECNDAPRSEGCVCGFDSAMED